VYLLLRVPGQLYQEHKDGTITNLYKIKIVNKAPNTLPFSLSVEAPYAQIELVGQQLDSLDSGVHTEQTFFIKMPKDKLANRKSKLKVVILSNKEVIDTKEVSFLGGY
jgi:hypothetical protein